MKSRRGLEMVLLVAVIAIFVPLLPSAQEEGVQLPAGTKVRAEVPGRGDMASAYRDAVRLVRAKCPFPWPGARVERVVGRRLAGLPPGTSEERRWKAVLEATLEALGESKARMIPAREYREKFRTIVCGGDNSGIGVIPRESTMGVLLEVIDGFPAEEAGVRSGDELIAVDGQPVSTGREANALTLGTYHSRTRVTVRRGRTHIDFSMRREALVGIDLAIRQLAPDMMLVRVYYPGADLREELGRKLGSKRVSKLVVDLRHSPGGYLSAATDLQEALRRLSS